MKPRSPTAAVLECRLCAAIYVLRGDDATKQCRNEAYKGVICKGPLVVLSPARLRSVFIETTKVTDGDQANQPSEA